MTEPHLSNGELRDKVHHLEIEVKVLQAKLEEKDKTLLLQAKEYERRLEELNNAHARAERILATYVTRDIYETADRENRVWRTTVDKQLSEDDGRRAMATSMVAGVLAVMALLVSVWSKLFSG